MQIEILKSKISYATVTGKDLYYVGSITIDSELMRQANIIANEKVQIVNLNNGERLETYVISGEADSGVFALNGPAARRCEIGDKIFILSYARCEIEKAKHYQPLLVDLKERQCSFA